MRLAAVGVKYKHLRGLAAGRGGKCAVKPYAVQRLAGGVFDEHIPHADVAVLVRHHHRQRRRRLGGVAVRLRLVLRGWLVLRGGSLRLFRGNGLHPADLLLRGQQLRGLSQRQQRRQGKGIRGQQVGQLPLEQAARQLALPHRCRRRCQIVASGAHRRQPQHRRSRHRRRALPPAILFHTFTAFQTSLCGADRKKYSKSGSGRSRIYCKANSLY